MRTPLHEVFRVAIDAPNKAGKTIDVLARSGCDASIVRHDGRSAFSEALAQTSELVLFEESPGRHRKTIFEMMHQWLGDLDELDEQDPLLTTLALCTAYSGTSALKSLVKEPVRKLISYRQGEDCWEDMENEFTFQKQLHSELKNRVKDLSPAQVDVALQYACIGESTKDLVALYAQPRLAQDLGGPESESMNVLGEALELAVQFDELESVNFLLKAGVDPNWGSGSIISAAIRRDKPNLEIIRDLLEAGLVPGNALITATSNRHVDVVKLFLEYGADVNHRYTQSGYTGRTAIYDAARLNNTELIKIFLEAGADVLVKDRAGITPSAWARKHKNLEIAELLEAEEERSRDDPNAPRAGSPNPPPRITIYPCLPLVLN